MNDLVLFKISQCLRDHENSINLAADGETLLILLDILG